MTDETILEFKDESAKYKFTNVPIYIDWAVIDGKIKKKQFCVIGIKNLETSVTIIHNLSDFIVSNWFNRDFNTQRNHCKHIVVFLNWLLKDRRALQLTNLKSLTLEHGTLFLNSFIDQDVSKGTVQKYERTLKYFYLWLSKNNVLDEIPSKVFVRKESQFGTYLVSPFKHVNYPSGRKKKKKEHLLPLRYIPLFLEIAILEAKPVALGIYMQMFGGIRPSGIINIRRTQLQRKVKGGDFVVDLKDQNFRSDLKNSSGGGFVKKPRDQMIFQIHGWGSIMFSDHCQLYKPTDGSGALFINNDGNAMTYPSYYQYFKKVKNAFISFLKKHGKPQDKLVANSLENRSWNSHIGRGTFTNLLAEEINDPYDLAFLRGDDSLLSSLTYIVGTSKYRDKMNEKIYLTHNDYIPRLIRRSKR